MPDKATKKKSKKDKKLKIKDKKKKHKEHASDNHNNVDEALPTIDEITVDVHPNAAIV